MLCEDEEQVDKLLELEGTDLRLIVFHDERGLANRDDPRLVAWARLQALGRELFERQPGAFEAEVAQGRGEDVAILCTTSGTTAQPKLTMLQHGPFLNHIAAYLRADPRSPTDEYVSILPLPWIMEQVYVAVMPLLCRIRVSFPESQETAMRDLREIGPTHILLAPRVWEQTAADARSRIMDAGSLTRRLFAWAVAVGTLAVERGRRHRLAELLMFAPLARPVGLQQSQVRRYRRRRPGTRHVPLLPGDGRTAQAALWPDRGRRRLYAAGASRDRLRQLRRALRRHGDSGA